MTISFAHDADHASPESGDIGALRARAVGCAPLEYIPPGLPCRRSLPVPRRISDLASPDLAPAHCCLGFPAGRSGSERLSSPAATEPHSTSRRVSCVCFVYGDRLGGRMLSRRGNAGQGLLNVARWGPSVDPRFRNLPLSGVGRAVPDASGCPIALRLRLEVQTLAAGDTG